MTSTRPGATQSPLNNGPKPAQVSWERSSWRWRCQDSGREKPSRVQYPSQSWLTATYAQRVALAGSSQLLRQVYVNAIGHCNFTDADMVAAIDAMNNVVAARHWTPGVTITALNAAANALDPALGGGDFTADHPNPLVVQNGLDR